MPKIEIIKNDEIVRCILLSTDSFVVGRQEGCDLVLDDEWISRRHLAFNQTATGSWEAVDLDSGNGSFVGAKRIRSALLQDGDVVRLGSSLLRFRINGAKESPPAQAERSLEPFLQRELAEEKSKNLVLQAELDVLRTATRKGHDVALVETGMRPPVLNPRLHMHFHRPNGQRSGPLGRAPQESGGQLKWGFLGLGRSGDAMVKALSGLGRKKVKVLLESLVPEGRIQSPAKLIARLEDQAGALSLPDALSDGVTDLVSWLGSSEKPLSDLFIMASADLFGAQSLATSRLGRFLRSLRADDRGGRSPRYHMIVIQDKTSEKVDALPWRSMLDLDLLQSVFCIDRQRVGDFAQAIRDEQVPFATTAGVLDSVQRLALRQPLIGSWDEAELTTFLSFGGFGTLACSATESLDDLPQAVAGLVAGGLFHGSFAGGRGRGLFLLAVIGNELAKDLQATAEIVRAEFHRPKCQWPQANRSLGIYVDSGASIRLFAGVSGQSGCDFSAGP